MLTVFKKIVDQSKKAAEQTNNKAYQSQNIAWCRFLNVLMNNNTQSLTYQNIEM